MRALIDFAPLRERHVRGACILNFIIGAGLYGSVYVLPLFLGFGERDAIDKPHAEPGHYPASRDVTLHVLAESGHCQYTASGRQRLWNRIDRWITSVIALQEDTHGQL